MRILRYLGLLSLLVVALAADLAHAQVLRPYRDWKAPVRAFDGTLQFNISPDLKANRQQNGASQPYLNQAPVRPFDGTLDLNTSPDLMAKKLRIRAIDALQNLNDNTCYFIRSYIMKRDDDTGATHLDHVTTCTPMSRFQMKKTAPARIVPAIER